MEHLTDGLEKKRGGKKQQESFDKHAKQHLGSLEWELEREAENAALLLGSFYSRVTRRIRVSFLQTRRRRDFPRFQTAAQIKNLP